MKRRVRSKTLLSLFVILFFMFLAGASLDSRDVSEFYDNIYTISFVFFAILVYVLIIRLKERLSRKHD